MRRRRNCERLRVAGRAAVRHGLRLHAGHGLNYRNVVPVAAIEAMAELNIGHAIVSRAVFVGLRQAVREMKRITRAICVGWAYSPHRFRRRGEDGGRSTPTLQEPHPCSAAL